MHQTTTPTPASRTPASRTPASRAAGGRAAGGRPATSRPGASRPGATANDPEPEAPARTGLLAFERTYLERLRLAAEVILELAEDDAIPDVLEVELRHFKDQVERALLLPDRRPPG